jgi:hypothetical protein
VILGVECKVSPHNLQQQVNGTIARDAPPTHHALYEFVDEAEWWIVHDWNLGISEFHFSPFSVDFAKLEETRSWNVVA